MIELSEFWIFLGGALLLNITPGQDMAYTLASAARGGRRAGLAAAGGIGAGSLAWSLIAATGLAVALAAAPNALAIIRMIGAFYLFFLAVRIISKLDAPLDMQGAAPVGEAFRLGVFTNLFNPKVGLFFLAFLPGFTNPETGSIWKQMLFLGGVFSLSSFLVLSGVAFGASAVRNTLQDTKAIKFGLNAATAILFIIIGFRLLLTNPI